jgi:hypothetical protein
MTPQSPFGAMLFNTARECADKPATVLAETLRQRVRQWADEQPNWNANLHLTKPPTSGLFWAVIEDCTGDLICEEVAYDDEASFWMRQDQWSRQDGEAGTYGEYQIKGWTHDREDAEEAAELLTQATQ